MNKASQKCFHTLIHSFRLTISLRVIWGAHPELSISQSEQLSPKFTGEYWIPIRYDGLRNAMQTVNLINICCSHLRCWKRMRQRNEMTLLGKLIHYYQNAVILAGLWEAFHEIKWDHLPCMIRYWKRLKKPRIFVTIWFCLLANRTSLHIFSYNLPHFGPRKNCTQSVISCRCARMTPHRSVMPSSQHFLLQLYIMANPDSLLVTQQSLRERKMTVRSWVSWQFCNDFAEHLICSIAGFDLIQPARLTEWDSIQDISIRNWSAR